MRPADLRLIHRFLAAHHSIEHHLRAVLGKDSFVAFSQLLWNARRDGLLRAPEAAALQRTGDLRNLLSHGETAPNRFPAVPTRATVVSLEAIQERLIRPATAIPTFRRPVQTVVGKDSLATVLRLIHDRDYSQFPVYEDEQFVGLLTENGITRWLAHQLVTELSLVEFEDVKVSTVLRKEAEKKSNCIFEARTRSVPEIRQLFLDNELLEAVLLTQNGKPTEKLLGIATRWDLVHQDHKI